MKKLLIITISIMIILAISSSVIAKAVQLELTPTSYGPGLTEIGTGKVILNNPKGAINFIVQVNIKNAKANTTYKVWIIADQELLPLDHDGVSTSWFYLGELLTNEIGNGSFHSNIKLELNDPGVLSDIQVALNPGPLAGYKSEIGEIEIK